MRTKAPELLRTERLLLRRPQMDDAEAIFERYASDPAVTRYVGWARHTHVSMTRDFVAFADASWTQQPAGPYLVETLDGRLIGGTGLMFDAADCAMTGYILAQDAWGRGFATEALLAMVALAPTVGVRRLYAICHAHHDASAHVLEKGGFVREGVLRAHTVFPNISPEPADVLSFAREF
jgi:RimJ/RimL family protein N-acetyltransferase